MGHRGRCRCGNILDFARGPDGYKMRCPACGSVVRLRAEDAKRRRRRRSDVLALKRPIPDDTIPLPDSSPPVPPEQYNYEALDPGELPVVEMVPLSELPGYRPPSRLGRWVLLTTTLVAVIGGVVALILFLGRT
jgi:hypothetical protein